MQIKVEQEIGEQQDIFISRKKTTKNYIFPGQEIAIKTRINCSSAALLGLL